MILCMVVGILAVIYHINSIPEDTGRLQLGLISNAATILVFASPLSAMVYLCIFTTYTLGSSHSD